MTRVAYQLTNESLDAVINGLSPNENDKILAVLGSGDQAFAMLAYGAQVIAADNNPAQVDFVNRRINQLKNKEYWEFFDLGFESPLNISRKTFLGNKLEKIRANLDNLTILEPANVLEALEQQEGLTKIYLSNCIGYCGWEEYENLRSIFEILAEKIPVGGLIYVTNGRYLNRSYASARGINSKCQDAFLPVSLRIDEQRTRIAEQYEDLFLWTPVVYKKAFNNFFHF